MTAVSWYIFTAPEIRKADHNKFGKLQFADSKPTGLGISFSDEQVTSGHITIYQAILFMGTGWSDHLGDTAAEQTLSIFGNTAPA